MSTVFLALQTNEETRPIIEAILQDNPGAVCDEQPAMVKINADGKLVDHDGQLSVVLGADTIPDDLRADLAGGRITRVIGAFLPPARKEKLAKSLAAALAAAKR